MPKAKAKKAAGSAAKPASDHCLIAFYNIRWDNGRLNGKDSQKHEEVLGEDINVALRDYHADILLLCECGEIAQGLEHNLWVRLVRRLAGPGFVVKHQSHYTSIVRLSTVQIREGPMLMGPMATWQGLHEYRMCQFLSIEFKDLDDNPIIDKPINVFNCHSPSSKKHPMNPTVRKEILQWLREHAGARAIIGGVLNSTLMALDSELKEDPDIHYLYEEDHWHGDRHLFYNLFYLPPLPVSAAASGAQQLLPRRLLGQPPPA